MSRTPCTLLVFVLVCGILGAGCTTWKPTSRSLVTDSGEPLLFTQKHRFDGDLRVLKTDSTTVELKRAYALDYSLHGTAENGKVEIPLEDIQEIEEKHTPEGFSPRAFVVVGILVTGLVIGATKAS